MRSLCFLVLLAGTLGAVGQAPQADRSITEADARKFGEQIEREFQTNGPGFLVKAIDFGRLLDLAMEGQPGGEKFKAGFRAGALEKGFGENFARAMERFSSYTFLRLLSTNSRPQLVFRALDDQGALNYHILELEQSRGRRLRIVDMFVMLSGEKMSETLRRFYLAAAAEADRSLLTRLTQGQGVWLQHSGDIQTLGRYVQEGNHQAALKLYDRLPELLRREKTVLLMRLQAASGADEQTYLSVIEAFERRFPRDPSLALVSIDGYVIKKQPRKAIDSIEKLDRFIGGDPYLLLLQAGQYLELKDRDKARQLARKSMEQEPRLPSSYDFLLALALQDKDYVETARLLSLAERHLEADMLRAIQDMDEYAPFLESPAGKKWKEAHESR